MERENLDEERSISEADTMQYETGYLQAKGRLLERFCFVLRKTLQTPRLEQATRHFGYSRVSACGRLVWQLSQTNVAKTVS